jgi:hypothetical protein
VLLSLHVKKYPLNWIELNYKTRNFFVKEESNIIYYASELFAIAVGRPAVHTQLNYPKLTLGQGTTKYRTQI